MNLKTYRARSMAECLTEVKKDLGGNAVILRTRSYKVGGMMGLGGRPMVEITASNDPVPNTFRPATRSAPKTAALGTTQMSTPASAVASASATDHAVSSTRNQFGQTGRSTSVSAGQQAQSDAVAKGVVGTSVLRETAAVVRPAIDGYLGQLPGNPAFATESVPDLGRSTGRSRAVQSLATPVELLPTGAGASQALHDELASIKRMVGQVLRVSRRSAVQGVVEQGGMPEPMFDVFRTLTDQGLDPDLVDQVLSETRDELDAHDVTDASAVETTAANRLAALIPVVGRAAEATTSAAKIVAVVGPTGVGKTTTIAKLAATLKLRHQRRVGLITCDTYRIAAVEQLRVYADIIGLDLKVAMTPQEARRHRESMSDCDVVMVDTAGRSPHDDRRLEELRDYIDVLEPDETHLVLSLAAAEGVMTRAAERFAGLRPDRLLMTKLDESVAFGPMVNIARSLSLPVGYVTTGQEVPDHFERADAARLARIILRGGGGW